MPCTALNIPVIISSVTTSGATRVSGATSFSVTSCVSGWSAFFLCNDLFLCDHHFFLCNRFFHNPAVNDISRKESTDDGVERAEAGGEGRSGEGGREARRRVMGVEKKSSRSCCFHRREKQMRITESHSTHVRPLWCKPFVRNVSDTGADSREPND